MKLQPVQAKILRALAASCNGCLTVREVVDRYETEHDGMRVASLVRWGLADWLYRGARATHLEITMAGRERIAREPVVSGSK
jgi:hypothetical protein